MTRNPSSPKQETDTPRPCSTAEHTLTETELAADVQVLSAMGSDTRYEALRLVAETDGDVCVCELEPALGVSQSAVSQALSRLHAAGLVTRRKEGRWRYYAVTPQAECILDALAAIRRQDDE